MLTARGAPSSPARLPYRSFSSIHCHSIHLCMSPKVRVSLETEPPILRSSTLTCSEPLDLWSPVLHVSRPLRGNRDHSGRRKLKKKKVSVFSEK